MENAMEFSDVLLEPSEAAAFLKVSSPGWRRHALRTMGRRLFGLVAAFGTARPRFFVG
jgi:hypothetical protein